MSNSDALIEIAIDLMKTKNKPQIITAIAKEVFDAKCIKLNEKSEEYSQFVIDFMLCGDFIVCGEDKKGNKLWDLKNRQHHDMQDKEGFYIDDLYEDEEVAKNELKDEYDYVEGNQNDFDNSYNQDDEEESEEKDDIEEELEESEDLIEGEEKRTKEYDADDDVEEDSYDDEDED